MDSNNAELVYKLAFKKKLLERLLKELAVESKKKKPNLCITVNGISLYTNCISDNMFFDIEHLCENELSNVEQEIENV